MYLEAGKWDYQKNALIDSDPKVLYTLAPIIQLKPKKKTEPIDYKYYECPVYKTMERQGMLSSLGQSTNYVFSIKLATDKRKHRWILMGTALLCSLSE